MDADGTIRAAHLHAFIEAGIILQGSFADILGIRSHIDQVCFAWVIDGHSLDFQIRPEWQCPDISIAGQQALADLAMLLAPSAGI